jgi:putative transposase
VSSAGWGFNRSRGTPAKNILKANGLDPGPRRGIGTWDEFLKIHAATLWQCDFLSVRALTRKGVRDHFLLVFLHVDSRRVFVTPATYHPNEAWVTEQAEAFVVHARETGLGVDIVMHDRDTKFTAAFDDVLKKAGLRVQKAAYCSPNTVAFVERFIQTLGQECLDHFIIFGERHLNHLCGVFIDYYHRRRPHQAKENHLLTAEELRRRPRKKPRLLPAIQPLSEIRCEDRLGGLLKHYYRRAA